MSSIDSIFSVIKFWKDVKTDIVLFILIWNAIDIEDHFIFIPRIYSVLLYQQTCIKFKINQVAQESFNLILKNNWLQYFNWFSYTWYKKFFQWVTTSPKVYFSSIQHVKFVFQSFLIKNFRLFEYIAKFYIVIKNFLYTFN